MEDRIKLPFSFDPDRLKEDLQRLEGDEWIDNFVRQNYAGSWTIIPLRGPFDAQHPAMMVMADPHHGIFADTPFLARCPYFQEVLSKIECPLDSVRIMKLSPGSIIKEHRDRELAFEHGHVRLHVPIITNPDVEFVLNDRRVILAEGECWYLRLLDRHRVANRGTTDRVHLVIDGRVNAWVEAMLKAGAPE